MLGPRPALIFVVDLFKINLHHIIIGQWENQSNNPKAHFANFSI